MLIAIEGIDGSGKRTQTEMLIAAAKDAGLSVEVFSFPRYGATTFSKLVADYLNGNLGEVMDVPPQISSILYAGDRFESKEQLKRALKTNDLVICDRYVPSNLAHQAAKLPVNERPAFYSWLETVEYGIYGLPRPDLTLLLNIPVELSMEMVAKKPQRDYTERSHDIHESNVPYLVSCHQAFLEIVGNDPNGIVINCAEGSQLLPPRQIANTLWMNVQAHILKAKQQ